MRQEQEFGPCLRVALMEFDLFDFRLAREILEGRAEWSELRTAIEEASPARILETHNLIAAGRTAPPAGGQTAINAVFRELLKDWTREPRLFPGEDERMRSWKMDFLKNRVGVEIAFNHAEAVPWTFTRLNIAGESPEVLPEHRIDVGVALFATGSLKSWARMDAAVGTFELACEWLRHMRPLMPIPVLVVGLRADGWPETSEFRGTRRS
jgi:hypothetical protein